MRLFAPLACALAALALAIPAAHAQAPTQASAWIEYVGGTAAEVRALAPDGRCPAARVDGEALALSLRAAPDAAFPVAVCQAALPRDARRVSVGAERLAAPKRTLKRVVILADTGCRIKGGETQACDDPNAWRFPAIARLAAARRPDLVIHVGDYFYRESACPSAKAGCGGSPFGDREPSWDADFLQPARPLLEAAPWVFVRGNHESCARGAKGWFRMFDAAAAPLTCPTLAAPFKVELPGLNLYVLDSGDADDRLAGGASLAGMNAQLDALKPDLAAPGAGWVLTHRPVWGLVSAANLGPLGIVEVAINATEQAAVRGRDLGGVQMMVSGHIHHFASFDFGRPGQLGRPAQLIVGTGGDVGDKADTPVARAGEVEIDGAHARRFTFYRYGYLVLDRVGEDGDWTGAFHGADDAVMAACHLHARSLTCREVRK